MESKPVGSYESTGIDVLIIGTGLAGLVAALECTRKGHNVKVLERSADINTAGEMDQLNMFMRNAHMNYR
jgi:2-polyprenyl-6-methoxyphenol hydroxylase-like FAD-dependent oxidoreductase